MPPIEYDRQVFLNCPFDDDYKTLLRALAFTILDCGLVPRLASDRADSGEVRVEKIRNLIRSCRFSIHDISRMEPLNPGDLPRFNMPFELGLDLGCRFYGSKRLAAKECLILEREKYRYQRVLSDISGNDIRAHGGDPQALISEVRKWLQVTTSRELPSGSMVWQRFSEFTSFLQTSLRATGFTVEEIDSLEISELIQRAQDWIKATRTAPN
ncbi:MAG TPA: hypothetical protein VLE27_01395 [Thermoanaerobaculia bacterium]|nr:hypothetical protein [Thermoanaerobaculia bacterium]